MNRRELSHWDYDDDDQYDFEDQYDYQDQYNSYSNDNYQSNSYRNGGGRFQHPSSNGKGRKSNAGRSNNQQSVSRRGQQNKASNDEPTVGHVGLIEVVPSTSAAIPLNISKMVPAGSNIVLNVININHNY